MNSGKMNTDNAVMWMDLEISEDRYQFAADIKTTLKDAELELSEIVEKLNENIESLNKLTPQCDKTDYILAVCSGVLCGVMDIFLIGKPGESPIGEITDQWFENRVTDFAGLCGWNGQSLSSAIRYLEAQFKIPYDQTGAGDAGRGVFDLKIWNHHFKSLGHNPTLAGLFFSILDQFGNTSHFVSKGQLISLQKADDKFKLQGGNVTSKLFCGFVNWLGHLISDVSGSSGAKGRGMGIPSPLWIWINDVIAIKSTMKVPANIFDLCFYDLCIEIYKQGYDLRFQTAQIIPVLINELMVRVLYSVRRMVGLFSAMEKENQSLSLLWQTCEPFSNETVKRMLTVAHGSFCLIDAGDAVLCGFTKGCAGFNVQEFVMRLNIVGVGRFSILLYGEAHRGKKRGDLKQEIVVLKQRRRILEDYVEGLKYLADVYDDQSLLSFVEDLQESDLYIQAFEKTVLMAEKRKVPEDKILRSKADIDSYFTGRHKL